MKYNDCATVGNLLGTRMILNEFVAFVDLGKIGSTLDPKSFVITTFALCGFANLSSVAIQITKRNRRASPKPSRISQARLEGDDGGNDGEFYVGLHCGDAPVKIGVVLGSGLGAFADALENRRKRHTLKSPDGPSVLYGRARWKARRGKHRLYRSISDGGRAHLYEGYTAQQITFGIRELKRRGAGALVLTNAAGGINLNLHAGQLVLISDHINLMGVNPLIGPNDDAEGPRFPDMTEAYSKSYREIAKKAGSELGVDLAEDVYATVDPNYETPAGNSLPPLNRRGFSPACRPSQKQ